MFVLNFVIMPAEERSALFHFHTLVTKGSEESALLGLAQMEALSAMQAECGGGWPAAGLANCKLVVSPLGEEGSSVVFQLPVTLSRVRAVQEEF